MKKKGQVTVAIILVVVLILATGIIFYLRPSGISEAERVLIDVPEQARPIAIYIQDCIENVATPGIFLIASQGGTLNPSEKSLETEYAAVGYGYNAGEDVLPSITEIELAIAMYMDIAVAKCADLSIFEKQGFTIEVQEIMSSALITWNNVVINVEMPLIIKKSDFETRLDKFGTIVPIRLGYAYNVSKEIIKKQMEDPEFVDFTYISELGLDTSIIPVDDENFIYSVADNQTIFEGGPFIFLFANRFVLNVEPRLVINDTFTIDEGQRFVYDVNTTDFEEGREGVELIYSDDTSMFDISETGLIDFTPQVRGTYEVLISVTDEMDNMHAKAVIFEVR
jgi:hypothetical protein